MDCLRNHDIKHFIAHFKGYEYPFLNGMCYWFAYMLHARFGGEIMYAPINNHFVLRLDNHLWDVRGEVTSLYSDVLIWKNYYKIDPQHFARIVRDCIDKETQNT